MLPGYFRLNEGTYDVRRCPDAAANCPAGESTCLMTTSACAGGRNMSTICQPGLTGTFCRSCVESYQFFVKAERGVVAHCELCDNALSVGSLLGTAAVALGTVLSVVLLALCIMPQKLWRFYAYCRSLIQHHTLHIKLKILIGFYMIAVSCRATHDSPAPSTFSARFTAQTAALVRATGQN